MITVKHLCEFNFPASHTNASVVVSVTNETNEDNFVVNIDEQSLSNNGNSAEAIITVVDSE